MTTATQTQTEKQPVVREDLNVRILLWRVKNPGKKLSQEKIARAIGYHQSSVSLAIRNPERAPDAARKIERYLDRLESRMQSTAPSDN